MFFLSSSSDLFPNSKKKTTTLPSCYLECVAGTPLRLIEKFIRLRHSLGENLQIDLFYEKFLLNKDSERVIDICYCFDRLNKNQQIELRFLVSPFGYRAILNHIRQSKKPPNKTEVEIDHEPKIQIIEATSLEIEVPEKPSATLEVLGATSPASSSCDSPSVDPKLKVKIRRSEISNKDWYIPQSQTDGVATTATTTTTTTTNTTLTEPAELPDLVNSCETVKKTIKRKTDSTSHDSTATKKKPLDTSTFFNTNRTSINRVRTKPRRRTPFIPTMVQAPPSIFDRLSADQYDYSDRDSDTSPICPNSELLRGSVTMMRPAEMVIVNVEGNVNEPMEEKRTKKTICKVPPYVPEIVSPTISPPVKTAAIVKPTPVYPNSASNRRTLIPKRLPAMIPTTASRLPSAMSDSTDAIPLDLSLK